VPQEVEKLVNGALNPVADTRMDKLPIHALLAAGRAMKDGMKYEIDLPDNWRLVPAEEHWNHATRHMLLYRAGDRNEPHIGHAVSRVLMWAELCLEVEDA